MVKIASADKSGGLEARDRSWRGKPDKNGTIDVPDRLAGYADEAVRSGMFTHVGKQFGGFGDGKLPKPYGPAPEDRPTEEAR